MSQTDTPELAQALAQFRPSTGPDRYVRFAETFLDVARTQVLEDIAESLHRHKYTLAIGGNGLGKSYAAAILGLSALYTNADTVVPITAGNGDTLKNSIWKPILGMFRRSGLPGDFNKSDRSIQTTFDPEWFLELHSPQYPEDLEGDHNANVVYIIEEAEKPGVTAQHIDSARSTMGDDDHMLVLANPPEDETNIVYELQERESWNVLRFPTWESRNAKVDRGLSDKDRIGGLSGVGKMRDDWREYHDEPWPGIERVIEISSPYLDADGNPTVRECEAERENPEFRTDLHSRWYKRRAGVMPPQGSATWRPFSINDVRAAVNRTPETRRATPTEIGVDVARGETSGDDTVAYGLHADALELEYTTEDDTTAGRTSYPQQETELAAIQGPDKRYTVDAQGEGSGLAQYLAESEDVQEYSHGQTPVAPDEFRYRWEEALHHFGQWLRDGGCLPDTQVVEEAKAAARVVSFSEQPMRGETVIKATPKDEIKAELGTSPDHLDAALQAIWAERTKESTRNTVEIGW